MKPPKLNYFPIKIPDTELLAFAEEFSKNYKIFSGGSYCSKTSKYHILYFDGYMGSPAGMPSETFARVNSQNGTIELDKVALVNDKKITNNFVFYLILWCVKRLEVESEMEADIKALHIYLALGRPSKDVRIGWLEQFNKKRYREIDAFISGKKIKPATHIICSSN